MTTQEIVKALRCCAEPNCDECPRKPKIGAICMSDDLILEAANIIEAQDELIKVLKTQTGNKNMPAVM